MSELFSNFMGWLKAGLDSLLSDGLKMLIAMVVGYGISWVRRRRTPTLGLLGMCCKGKWAVYFGNTRTGDSRLSAFDSGTLGYVYGDMEATLRVVETMAELVGCSPSYHRAMHDPRSVEGSIISIGGPKWNGATEYLIGKLGSPVYYKEGEKALFVKRKGTVIPDKLDFCEVPSGSITQVRDYGVIIVGRKSYFKGLGDSQIESACVLMGYSTVGVRVAAEYLRTLANPSKVAIKKLLSESLSKSSNRFCLIISADVRLTQDGDYVDHTEAELTVINESDFLSPYPYSYG